MCETGSTKGGTTIRAVGIGGGGMNIVDTLLDMAVPGVEPIVMNTDAAALAHSRCPHKLRLGTETFAAGAGGNPTLGRQAAEESREALTKALAGAKVVFIMVGMGGGTGTGAAPVVAEIARTIGAQTIGLVTKPFDFEYKQRSDNARQGTKVLSKLADFMAVVPCEDKPRLTVQQALAGMNQRICQFIKAVAERVEHNGGNAIEIAELYSILTKSNPDCSTYWRESNENIKDL